MSVRFGAELEAKMNAVERMLEYSGLPTEPRGGRGERPPAAWPAAGAIAVTDLHMRYRQARPPARTVGRPPEAPRGPGARAARRQRLEIRGARRRAPLPALPCPPP
eukprot:tig00001024_g6311.t1